MAPGYASTQTGDGNRVTAIREGLGLSQRELASALGVSAGAVCLWESGDRAVPGPVKKLIETMARQLDPAQAARKERVELLERCRGWVDAFFASLPANTKTRLAPGIRDTFARSAFDYLRDRLPSHPVEREIQISRYSQLVRELSKAKGLPLKVIQMASYLDPTLPAELRSCLSLLQNANTPIPAGVVARVIFEDFGSLPKDLFAEWDPKPVAVASIGQVHRARLASGRLVAVKVQYPGLRDRITSSFRDSVLRQLLARLIPFGSPQVLSDFEAKVMEELDFKREAEQQSLFHRHFKDHPRVWVPEIHWELSSSRVLTSGWIEGKSFERFKREADQAARNAAAETVIRFQAESAFSFHVMHADLHPGNLIFAGDRIGVIDFGRTYAFEREQLHWNKELLVAVVIGDKARGETAVRGLGIVSDWTDFDFDAFWLLVREQHSHFLVDGPVEFSSDYLARRKLLMRGYAQKELLRISASSFWNLFVVTAHDAIRAELRACSNWRRMMLQELRLS